MSIEDNEQKGKLIELVRVAVARDKALREKYQIGEKFRFVRDRLFALLEQLEKHLETTKLEEKKAEVSAADDEVLIYVYLYNSQGALLQTWLNMLTPKLFYEYSVNRPIYTERKHVDSLVHSKSNPVQHAFLTIAIKQKDILQNENPPQDAMGNILIKVKEGSLRFERLVSITHNDHDYGLTEQGTLVKKTP